MNSRADDAIAYSCPRCGAHPGSACERIRPGGFLNTLSTHDVRGLTVSDLVRLGYERYVLRNPDCGGYGSALFLWRKSSQPKVTRAGFAEVTS